MESFFKNPSISLNILSALALSEPKLMPKPDPGLRTITPLVVGLVGPIETVPPSSMASVRAFLILSRLSGSAIFAP